MKQPREIVTVPIGDLIPYARNARTHSDAQVAQIAASMREWGWTNPVLIAPDKTIIAGHGRVMAARKLGVESVPCIVANGWTDAQVRAYVIADNKLALNAGWDTEMLAMELGDLRVEEFNLELTGFDVAELDSILSATTVGTDGLTDQDDVPETPQEAVTRTGDVWLLGKHRLMCGDSTDASVVEMLMVASMADAVLTDPPYGQGQLGVPGDEPNNLAYVVKSVRCLPVQNAVIVAFQSPRTFHVWMNECTAAGHMFERMLWVYKRAQNSYPWRGWLLTSEAILVTSIGNPKWQEHHPYTHDCYMLSEVSGELDDNIGWHGSVKPLSVVADIAQRIASHGGLIYEPFSGSGTTIIAAEKTGRVCYAMELSPNYVDVAVKRWQAFTGLKAVRESDGVEFDQVAMAQA